MSNFFRRLSFTSSASAKPAADDFVHIASAGAPSSPPATSGPASLSVSLAAKHSTVPEGQSVKNAYCATIRAREAPETDDERGAADISVALDVSGSMSGSKLDMCKQTLVLLLQELNAKDRFSLTLFHNGADVMIPLQNVTSANRDLSIAKINAITPQGCTNLSGGITSALTQLLDCASPSPVRSVVVLTDGHANRGVDGPDALVELLNGYLDGVSDVSINVMGYGENHNADLLRRISQTSTPAGSYYFIEKTEDVSAAFGDCIGGLLSTAAQNVVVRIRGTGLEVLHDKAKNVSPNCWTVNLGDMFAEEMKDLVVRAPVGASSIEVQVSYVDVFNTRPVNSDVLTCSIESTASSTLAPMNIHAAMQLLRVMVVSAMKNAKLVAENRNVAQGRTLLDEALEYFKEMEEVELGEERATLDMLKADCLSCRNGMTSFEEYDRVGSKYMASKVQTHLMQRCCESDSLMAAASVYRGSSKSKKASLAEKFRSIVK